MDMLNAVKNVLADILSVGLHQSAMTKGQRANG